MQDCTAECPATQSMAERGVLKAAYPEDGKHTKLNIVKKSLRQDCSKNLVPLCGNRLFICFWLAVSPIKKKETEGNDMLSVKECIHHPI